MAPANLLDGIETGRKESVSSCQEGLKLVLSFFPRVDAKASVVFAIDTGMLGYLAARFQPLSTLRWWEMIAPALVLVLVALSYWCLYACAFPNLKGGDRSLIYFSEIAKRTESKFIDEFLAQTEVDYAKDVLGQTWRNAEILAGKFKSLKLAFLLTGCATLPWVVALMDFAVKK